MSKLLGSINNYFGKIFAKGPLLICAAAYGFAFLTAFVLHFAGFVINRAAYASGTLKESHLQLADFDFYDIELLETGEIFCYGSDPRLLLKDSTLKVENIQFNAEYSLPPELVNVFWAAPGQQHSQRRMAYSIGQVRNMFFLPLRGGQALRIDPGSVAGNVIRVNEIIVNQKRPFWTFFMPTGGEIALFLALPGLFVCGLFALRNICITMPFSLQEKAGDSHV